jgi:hypothetical protein
MKLLCVLWSHRYVTVANPGEEPYQWCQRCQHYRAAAWGSTGQPRPGGGVVDFGGQSGNGDYGGGSGN